MPITASHNRIIWTGAPGKEYQTTVTLKHTNGKSFRVLDAKSSSPLLKVVGLTKGRAAAEHKFDIIFSAGAKAGGYQEILTFKLDDTEQNKLEIAVAAALR